jgi:hypothetical protein
LSSLSLRSNENWLRSVVTWPCKWPLTPLPPSKSREKGRGRKRKGCRREAGVEKWGRANKGGRKGWKKGSKAS